MWKSERSAIRFASGDDARYELVTNRIAATSRPESSSAFPDRPVALSILSTGTRLYAETPWRSRFRPIGIDHARINRKKIVISSPWTKRTLEKVRNFKWRFICLLDRNRVINYENFFVDVHNLKYIGEISCTKMLIMV